MDAGFELDSRAMASCREKLGDSRGVWGPSFVAPTYDIYFMLRASSQGLRFKNFALTPWGWPRTAGDRWWY